MNFGGSNLKFYTNIFFSGALSTFPTLYYFLEKQINFHFAEISLLCVFFIGRICLECAFFIENYWIDTIVLCKVKNPSHYVDYPEPGNLFNKHWFEYLKLNNNKMADEIISHIADRMLFFSFN